MKKVNSFLVALFLLGAASCSQEELVDSRSGSEELVSITLDMSESLQTRALGNNTNSAGGGLVNVDWDLYDLRYQFAIYDETGATQIIAPKTKISADGYTPVSFEFRLISGRTYKFVSWADFVRNGEVTDLHYTTTDFAAITIKDASNALVNDESRDAFFVSKNIAVANSFNETLTLKRPFAKLRVIATDWGYENLPAPDNFKVTYRNCTRFEGINMVTGEAISRDGSASGKTLDATGELFTGDLAISKSEKYYKKGYDADPNNRTLFVDYLFTNESQQPIHFNLEMLDGTSVLATRDFTTNIPVQRNWLTTVIGNLLTTQGEVNISIDDKFINEHISHWLSGSGITPSAPALVGDTYHITSREEFAWLPDNVAMVIGKKLVLEADIDMSGVDWKPIHTADYQRYQFDGKGHTLRNFTVNGKYGAVEGGTRAYVGVFGRFTGEMKNVTYENIVINGLANTNVDVDGDGNPIEHNKEAAYFAGVIGHGGQNWPALENVHVKNITVKASPSQRASSVGGLIGFIGSSSTMNNCSVVGADLLGYETGGIVGKSLAGCHFISCSAEDITIRIRPMFLKTTYVSGFVGKVETGALFGERATAFTTCTAPTELVILNDNNGSVSNYEPAHALYGGCPTNPELIVVN